MDVKKAYDSVAHSTGLKALLRAATSRTVITAIMAVYEKAEACVRANNDLADFFDWPRDLKQGSVASSTQFSIIIKEIAIYIQEGGKHILLFADDIILMSVGQSDLQK